jgi:hypothetical protein
LHTNRENQLRAVQHATILNCDGIQNSMSYLPDCTFKRYCQWILKQPVLSGQWLQLAGITNLTKLALGLLDGLLEADQLEILLPYTVPINIFNMYEVVSDNLAIGLAARSQEDSTYVVRCEVVHSFNRAMIARLQGHSELSLNILGAIEPLAQQISLFDQSLSSLKHQRLARAFADQNPEIELRALEYSVYPNLVGNFQACNDVVQILRGYLTQDLVRNGFIWRYAAVNRMIEDQNLSRDELVELGTRTIMVIPVLAYFISVIAEEVYPLRGYQRVFDSGLLRKALEDAALLVRLLNDIGPHLLPGADKTHDQLVQELRSFQSIGCYQSFSELLLAQLLTRLVKDLKYGEFNIALYEPCRQKTIATALTCFRDQLGYYSWLYHTRMARLQDTLVMIQLETSNTIISEVILRFIRFNERLYQAPFQNPEGEFAV